MWEKKLKGGVSQIIVATVLTPMIVLLLLTLIISSLHIYARNNLNQIAQESVNEISATGTLTEELNQQYKQEIDKYKPFLKGYEVNYVFSQYNENTKAFEPTITMINNINEDAIGNMDTTKPTKVTMIIKQTETSTLQNIQNLISKPNDDSHIEIRKSMLISKHSL
ncbi:MAG TPA: hypothetical protein DDX02_08245 [Clostridiaceae bacterium]|jgi:hypothetical protein|nr:hypothetical protein [Clostridiaceae bacterium]